MISAVNGRKRALLTKSALEWHNKRCTAQFTLCVGNKKGKTELKAMCDKFFFFFFFVSRYLGRDTIHVSPAQVSRCIDASMHRYDPTRESSNTTSYGLSRAVEPFLKFVLQSGHQNPRWPPKWPLKYLTFNLDGLESHPIPL